MSNHHISHTGKFYPSTLVQYPRYPLLFRFKEGRLRGRQDPQSPHRDIKSTTRLNRRDPGPSVLFSREQCTLWDRPNLRTPAAESAVSSAGLCFPMQATSLTCTQSSITRLQGLPARWQSSQRNRICNGALWGPLRVPYQGHSTEYLAIREPLRLKAWTPCPCPIGNWMYLPGKWLMFNASSWWCSWLVYGKTNKTPRTVAISGIISGAKIGKRERGNAGIAAMDVALEAL